MSNKKQKLGVVDDASSASVASETSATSAASAFLSFSFWNVRRLLRTKIGQKQIIRSTAVAELWPGQRFISMFDS